MSLLSLMLNLNNFISYVWTIFSFIRFTFIKMNLYGMKRIIWPDCLGKNPYYYPVKVLEMSLIWDSIVFMKIVKN